MLRTIGGAHPLELVRGPASNRVAEVKVTDAGGRWVGPHSPLQEGSLTVPEGAVVTLRNQTEGSVLALLENVEWTRDATTAARATTVQEFRDLFGSEVLASGQHIALRHIALVFSSLEGSTELYETLGDAAAYGRIDRHFDFIKEVVASANGTIVKTIGDGTMCAFHRVDDALEAAIAIQQRIGPWCESEEIDPPLTVKLGLHSGPVIAATANGRLDYLGRTANVAAWLRDESRGGDVVMLPETLEQLGPAALEARTGIEVEPFTAPAHTHDAGRRLVRVTVRRRGTS